MAGIGFRIEKLLHTDSYSGEVRAYTHAAFVSAGNLLATYACLSALVYFTQLAVSRNEMLKFQVTVTYVYCFAMLLVGPLAMVTHRYLADVFYEGRPDKVVPCMRGAIAFHVAIGVPAALLFFRGCGFEGADLFGAATLYGLTVAIWVCSTFLTVLKAYDAITGYFIASLVLSFGAAYFMGLAYGYTGLLAGFTSGHLLLFLLIYGQVLNEFPPTDTFSFGWIRWARGRGWLIAAGLFANLGVWIDKLVFWSGPSATAIQGPLRYHEVYDPCVFLALLTAIPAYAHFLLVLETHFYRPFRRFCVQISSGSPYAHFARSRDQMALVLKQQFTQLAKLQGVMVLAVIFAAPYILSAARISPAYTHVLRVAAIGVALGVGVLLHIVLLLYFDLERDAALLGVFYTVTSGLGSALTVTLGLRYYGYGYMAAGLASLAAGLWIVDRRLRRLDYIIYQKNAVLSMSGVPMEAIP